MIDKYEYHCQKCGNYFRHPENANNKQCPKCDGLATRVWGTAMQLNFPGSYNASQG